MRSSRTHIEAFALGSTATHCGFIRNLWSWQPPLVGFEPTPTSGVDLLYISAEGLPWLYGNAAGIPPTRAFRTSDGGFQFLFQARPYMWCPARGIAPGVRVVAAARGAAPHGGTLYLDEPIATWPRWILDGIATRLMCPPTIRSSHDSQGARL